MVVGSKISSAGIIYRNSNAGDSQKTFILLGAPRGGTSMSAGILRLCGVNTGDVIDPDNQEDQSFLGHKGDYTLLNDETQSKEYIKGIIKNIKEKNKKYDFWGWKDPLSILYIERVIEHLRNPHFIVVTRDSVATAMRERVENHSDISLDFFMEKAKFSTELYKRSLEFVSAHRYPTLFISYERSLRNKSSLADLFLEFSASNEVHFDAVKRKIIEYTAPDKVTGNFNAKEVSEKYKYMEQDGIFSGCSSLTDVYSQAAKMVNDGEYEKALSLASLFEHIFIEGELVSPFAVSDDHLIFDLFVSSRFICGVANVNIGATRRALLDLSLFTAVYERYKSEKDLKISTSIYDNAKELFERLS